jgi:imidazolonepropionase
MNPASTKQAADLMILHATQLITCMPREHDPVGRIRDGAVAVAGEHILAVGTTAQVKGEVDASRARLLDASGKVVAPGFVDSHTHLVFGGSRVQEYAARMTRDAAALKALDIPKGILATVGMTRAASEESLAASAADRLGRMFRYGTTTVESKSGYGLTVADELKMLRVNRRLQSAQPIDIVSTFLGAHEFPQDLARDAYIDLIVNEMIPQVVEERLAVFCDVYCDEGYYTAAESRRILEAGRAAGLAPKIHTEGYSDIGGARVAADLPVVSADHLNYAPRAAMRRLAEANVVGVVMPGLDFAVGHTRPFDARAMLDEGMTLALATDLCPAAWIESMQLVMQLACRLYHLSPEEAIYAATVGGARALGLHDRGALAPGLLGDLQIWDVPAFEDVIYRLGNNAVETVIKRGTVYPSSS